MHRIALKPSTCPLCRPTPSFRASQRPFLTSSSKNRSPHASTSSSSRLFPFPLPLSSASSYTNKQSRRPAFSPRNRAPPQWPIHPPSIPNVQSKLLHHVKTVWLKKTDPKMLAVAADMGLSQEVFQSHTDQFARIVLREVKEATLPGFERRPKIIGWYWEELKDSCVRDGIDAIQRKLLNEFMNWASTLPLSPPNGLPRSEPDLSISKLHHLSRLTDFRNAGELFPDARRLKRKIILHVGPTNSGKTHQALVALSRARTGVYAGPLRLLAHEVFSRFNEGKIGEEGKRLCNLITGEEQRILDPNMALSSCTVEMFPLSRRLDVGVIDEIQMIGDPQRGSAWTNAVIGAQCDELHLCGEESVVELVQAIAQDLGDECIINRYQRLSPLVVGQSLQSDLSKMRKGDCLVTFSRSNIFAFKRNIEEKTGLRVAVAYGGLPPEVREEQARTFNEGGYDVLVASDAIGMGLNLKIKRIIFESLVKWNGKAEVPLSKPQIKQIAGRAGRFGVHTSPTAPDDEEASSTSTVGEVATLDERDMPLLFEAIRFPVVKVEKAAFSPPAASGESVHSILPLTTSTARLAEIVNFSAQISPLYYYYPDSAVSSMLDSIEHVNPLSFSERRVFASAPVNIRDPRALATYVGFCESFALGNRILIPTWADEQGLNDCLNQAQNLRIQASKDQVVLASSKSASATILQNLESFHRCLTVYLWLSYRLSDIFRDMEEARTLRGRVEKAIDATLAGIRFERRTLSAKARRHAAAVTSSGTSRHN